MTPLVPATQASRRPEAAQADRPKPLLGKYFLELRVMSDRLDLSRAMGTLRIEPAQGPPVLHSLHFENPSSPDAPPPDAERRSLRLGADGPALEIAVFRPPTAFARMRGAKGASDPDRGTAGYLFVDLLFDRPDPAFKAILTLDVDGRMHTGEFDYPLPGREAK